MDVRNTIQRFKELEGSPWTVACGISYTGVALFADSVLRTGVTSPAGLAEAAVAYACDLADGPTSRYMNQASERGSATDVVADKVKKTLAIGVGLREGFLPVPAALAVAGVTLSNAIATDRFESANPNQQFRANSTGKMGEFIQNLGFASYALGEIVAKNSKERQLKYRWAGHVFIGAGVGLSALAGRDYYRRTVGADGA